MKEIKSEEIINSHLINLFKGNYEDESLDIDLCSAIPLPSSAAINQNILCSTFDDEDEDEPNLYIDDYSQHEIRLDRKTFAQPKKSPAICDDEKVDMEVVVKVENPSIELKCDFCTMFFNTIDDCIKHEKLVHSVKFKCNQCEKDFLDEDSLKKHVKVHKSAPRKKDSAVMECPECGKLLKISSMTMHRKIHDDNKQFGCDVCGQKFVQKINLIHHTKIHTGEKPYECPQCQKAFSERSHLLRHQRYHAATRPFKCEKCGKMYKTERCLKVHNLVHLEKRPFVCIECNKSFISSSKLKQHSNIHTGERPYKCKYCSRDFTNFPNWLKHTRRRHKVDHKTGEVLQNVPNYSSSKTKRNDNNQKRQTNEKTSNATNNKKKKQEKKQTEEDNKTENTIATTNYRDICSLSITSAEDLIMEQALEMEEAGLMFRPEEDNNDIITSPDELDIVKMEPNILNTSGYDSTPFSSPSSDFQHYMPLPPIATMTANNFFSKTNHHIVLPSVETFFSSSNLQTTSSKI